MRRGRAEWCLENKNRFWILIVAAESLEPYHRLMKLVGEGLQRLERHLRLDSASIKQNLHRHLAEKIALETNLLPSPEDVAKQVEGIWRSWERWRQSEEVSPQQASQVHQAAGLGFPNLEACEAFWDAFRQGGPLPLRPTATGGNAGEAVGLVSPPYGYPLRVLDYLRELYEDRLEALPPDAKDYISERWVTIQRQAMELDEEVSALKRFLNLVAFRPTVAAGGGESPVQATGTGAEGNRLDPLK